jgi:hypothetical protein
VTRQVSPQNWRTMLDCTNRRVHSRAKIGELHWWNGGFALDKEGVEEFDGPHAWIIDTDGHRVDSGTAGLFCRRCRRKFPVSRDRALRLAQGAAYDRRPRIDLSLR